MKIFVIETQLLENYGAHAENGKWEDGNAYWKFKGGNAYIVHGTERVQDAVASVMAYIGGSDDIGWKEFPTEWSDYRDWRAKLKEECSEEHAEFQMENAIEFNVNDPAGEQYMNSSDPWVWAF